jgi:uncharacterized protein YlxP (DUF503 family)
MQNIRKKLHSNSGASMIMALLLMLVGVVTSAVIIAAALNAVLSVKEDRAQQQAYLTVSSAAELIRDELEEGKSDYTKTVTEVTTTDWWGNKTSDDPVTKVTVEDDSAIFSSIIKSAIEYLESYPTATYHETYTINADAKSADYADVSAEVFIKKTTDQADKYNLTIWFTGGEEPNQCRMALTMEGIITSDSSSSSQREWYNTITTSIITTTISWQNPHLQRKETTN